MCGIIKTQPKFIVVVPTVEKPLNSVHTLSEKKSLKNEKENCKMIKFTILTVTKKLHA
jgi:hypothetical protein